MTILPSLFFNKMNVNRFVNSVSPSRKSRSGVSPVIATTIILAITITLGLSLWSFANAGVGTATQSYASVITEFGKYTSDRFVIANMAFDHPSANHVSVWIYNSGESATEITSIILSCKDCASPGTLTFSQAQLTGTNPIPSKSLEAISFSSGALTSGNTYEVRVISSTGAYQTQFQAKQ
jgi:hypothetical protein